MFSRATWTFSGLETGCLYDNIPGWTSRCQQFRNPQTVTMSKNIFPVVISSLSAAMVIRIRIQGFENPGIYLSNNTICWYGASDTVRVLCCCPAVNNHRFHRYPVILRRVKPCSLPPRFFFLPKFSFFSRTNTFNMARNPRKAAQQARTTNRFFQQESVARCSDNNPRQGK